MTSNTPRTILLFYGTGAGAVIAGGITSAVTAGHPSYLASWAVAFIVLVIGVGQAAFGVGIRRFMRTGTSDKMVMKLFLLFNSGVTAVLVGTLLKHTIAHSNYIVYLGGLLLAVAIGLCLYVVRGAQCSRGLLVYYGLAIGLFVSMVVGMLLAHR